MFYFFKNFYFDILEIQGNIIFIIIQDTYCSIHNHTWIKGLMIGQL